MAQLSVSNIGGGKNFLINGGFDIWQRGLTFSELSNNTYAADRWNLFTVASTHTISRQGFTPGQTDVPGNPTYFMRVAGSGANQNRLIQKIEWPQVFSGQKVTLSFWAKSPDGGSLPYIYFTQEGFASGVRTDSGVGGISLTTSWQKFTKTVTFPSITGKTLNANTYASVEFYCALGYTVDFAQIKLELGAIATEFTPSYLAEELALCQRYYEFGSVGYLPCVMTAATAGYVTIPMKVTKRIAVTGNMTLTSPRLYLSGTWYDVTSTVLTGGTSHLIFTYIDSNHTYTLNSSYLAFGNWTASAEL